MIYYVVSWTYFLDTNSQECRLNMGILIQTVSCITITRTLLLRIFSKLSVESVKKKPKEDNEQKGLKRKAQTPGHPGNESSQSIGIGDLKDPKAGDPCLKGDLLRIGMDQCMTGSMDRKEVQCPLGVGRVLGEAVCPQGPLPGKTMPQGAIVFLYFIHAVIFKIDFLQVS